MLSQRGIGILREGRPYEVDARTVLTDDLEFDAEQPQDVASSRSDNTWETNSSNYPLVVYIVVEDSGAATPAILAAHINTAQSNNEITRSKIVAHDGTTINPSVTLVVPPGHHYKADWDAGTTLKSWLESKLGSP